MPCYLVLNDTLDRAPRDQQQFFVNALTETDAAMASGFASARVLNVDEGNIVSVDKDVTLVADDGQNVVRKTPEEVAQIIDAIEGAEAQPVS